jgi:hypothetical protein
MISCTTVPNNLGRCKLNERPLKTWVSTLILTNHAMMGIEIRKIYRANKFTCCRQGGTSIPGTDCHDHPSTYRLSYHQNFCLLLLYA